MSPVRSCNVPANNGEPMLLSDALKTHRLTPYAKPAIHSQPQAPGYNFSPFENWRNEPFSINKVGSEWLCYTAAGSLYRQQIFSSTDALNWTRETPYTLVEGTPGSWDDKNVETFHVGIRPSPWPWWCAYAGRSVATNKHKIGLACSSDGRNWIKYASNPVLSYGVGTWDDGEVSRPTVYPRAGWDMLYTGFALSGPSQIGLAHSDDFFTWTKHPTPILSPGTWDSAEVGYQWPVVDTDGLHVFYAGGPGGVEARRIGHAFSATGSPFDLVKDPVPLDIDAPAFCPIVYQVDGTWKINWTTTPYQTDMRAARWL